MDLTVESLNLEAALIWSAIWIIFMLVLGNKLFWWAITSGISFFVWYVIISVILSLICSNGGYCFP
jgi:hypothetical protein